MLHTVQCLSVSLSVCLSLSLSFFLPRLLHALYLSNNSTAVTDILQFRQNPERFRSFTGAVEPKL